MCLLSVLTCFRLLRRFPKYRAGKCGGARGGVTLDLFCVAICFSIVFRLYVMMIITTVLALHFLNQRYCKLIINE